MLLFPCLLLFVCSFMHQSQGMEILAAEGIIGDNEPHSPTNPMQGLARDLIPPETPGGAPPTVSEGAISPSPLGRRGSWFETWREKRRSKQADKQADQQREIEAIEEKKRVIHAKMSRAMVFNDLRNKLVKPKERAMVAAQHSLDSRESGVAAGAFRKDLEQAKQKHSLMREAIDERRTQAESTGEALSDLEAQASIKQEILQSYEKKLAEARASAGADLARNALSGK